MRKKTSNTSVKGVVTGQNISTVKIQRSKDLRKNMTPAESYLWKRLRKNQLNGLHFRRQQVIGGMIADFYCHKCKLVVEVDGSVHKNQTDYDIARDKMLKSRGLIVIRFSNEQVLSDIETVLSTISEFCKELKP